MESLDVLQARHRKEVKDLQGRITNKKKQASKKTRKGVNAECEELEHALRERHARELLALSGVGEDDEDVVPDVDNVPELEDELSLSAGVSAASSPPVGAATTPDDTLRDLSISDTASTSQDGTQPRKRNRQKERLARRAAEQEAAVLAAEKEAAGVPDWRAQERTAMLKAFKENGLVEKEIQPDGHCLFSAVADQLAQAGVPLQLDSAGEQRYRAVRKVAARYIESHPDDFAAFLEEPLGVHVHKIRETAEWGGQIELIALAKSFNLEICVLQNGRIDRLVPEEVDDKTEKIWLAYYHHGYGLGEHYNSLRKAP